MLNAKDLELLAAKGISEKQIEEQLAWLRYRKNNSKIEFQKSCTWGPRVSIVAIKYTLDGKLYEYEVDEQTNRQLNQKLKHLFN